ncbi:MAG: MoaD family protein [Candidatus Helarchaeota archaeon]
MSPLVHVKLLLILSDRVGREELEIESNTIEDLERKIVQKFGDALLEDNLFVNAETGLFHDHMLVLVNGKNIRFLNGLNTELKEGDTIVICPPVAGG